MLPARDNSGLPAFVAGKAFLFSRKQKKTEGGGQMEGASTKEIARLLLKINKYISPECKMEQEMRERIDEQEIQHNCN